MGEEKGEKKNESLEMLPLTTQYLQLDLFQESWNKKVADTYDQ